MFLSLRRYCHAIVIFADTIFIFAIIAAFRYAIIYYAAIFSLFSLTLFFADADGHYCR